MGTRPSLMRFSGFEPKSKGFSTKGYLTVRAVAIELHLENSMEIEDSPLEFRVFAKSLGAAVARGLFLKQLAHTVGLLRST